MRLANRRSPHVGEVKLESRAVGARTIVAIAVDSSRVAVSQRNGRERAYYCLLEADSDRGTVGVG